MTKLQVKSIILLSIVTTVLVVVVFYTWEKTKLAGIEGEVYWSVVNEVFPDRLYPDNLAFISVVTTCESLEYPDDGVSDDVIDSFIQANNSYKSPLRMSFFEGVVPIADWETTKDVDNPNIFRSIPEEKNVVAISRAGFNKERTKALICLRNIRPQRHSNVLFFYLENKEGNWQVIATN